MNAVLRRSSLVVAVTLAVFAAGCANKVRLMVRLNEGDAYHLQVAMDQKITQTIKGQTQTMDQRMTFGYDLDVEEVDAEGNSWVNMTYRSLAVAIDGPMGKIEYDSANPPKELPPFMKGFAAMVGAGLSMKLTPAGRVTEVKGMDKMWRRVLEGVPDGPMKEGMAKSMKNQFGDSALRDIMRNGMVVFPDEPVGVGDSWRRKTAVKKGFPLVSDTTWAIAKRQGGIATITIQSVVTPNEDAPPLEMGPMKLKYILSGTQEGTADLVEATGWIKRADYAQLFEGTVGMIGGPEGADGLTWPIVIDSKIHLEMTEGTKR